ncbi:MAG: MoxR family ATPase [Lachnospiraceae bacterium]|nr:MoxR family ATPase [Lachnospiraceae bacterium]
MEMLDRSRLQDPVYMAQRIAACEKEIQKGIIGQKGIIRQVMLAMLTGGNVLLEGMPGLGKTRLVSTIGRVFDLSFKRIQFTPDLMPSDVTGTNIIIKNEQGSSFSFERGPVFSNLILADEINRATPKTQSALLEAMQEHTVTVGNDSHALKEPFFVLATQNPIENEGTYPLPEAQLDRFMFKILVRFPSKEELKGIVALTEGSEAPVIEKQMDGEGLLAARTLVNQIPIADAVMNYLLEIVMETHAPNPYIREGASPRAAQSLIRAARAKAFLEGRFNVSFQDVKEAAYPVLRHRIIAGFDAISKGITEDEIIKNILDAKSALFEKI